MSENKWNKNNNKNTKIENVKENTPREMTLRKCMIFNSIKKRNKKSMDYGQLNSHSNTPVVTTTKYKFYLYFYPL